MDDKLQKFKEERERIFANWRKWFIYQHTEVDANSSSDGVKADIAGGIGVEELRGIFTSGYIFAMIQTKQTFDEMNEFLERKDRDFTDQDTERYKYFLEVQNEMFKFIDEKIEDSYCLNTGKEFPISKKLLRFLKDEVVSYKSHAKPYNFIK